MPRMKGMENWKSRKGRRGPNPACECARERRRRIQIATNYVVDRMPIWMIAKIWDISAPTVYRYIREVYTYPEEDAGRLRAIELAAQEKERNREIGRPFP